MNSVILERLNRQLDELIAADLNKVFPAVTLKVIHSGKTLIHRAWGRIDPESRPVRVMTGTLFDLSSLTQLFTTAAFLSLVSNSRVGLDHTLVSALPEFGEFNPRSIDGGQDPFTGEKLPIPDDVLGKTVDPTRLTFRRLLTYTSGLAPWRDIFRAAGPAPPPPDHPHPTSVRLRRERMLKALCAHPFVGQPGSAVRCSDLGLMLLGEATARLYCGRTGRLDIPIYQCVTEPLALSSVMFNPLRENLVRIVIAPTENDVDWRGRRCWGEVHDHNACGMIGVAGHAGLFGAVSDVAAFGQAWLSRDVRLRIDPALMEYAVQEQAETDGNRRGLGWMLKSHKDSPAGDRLSEATYGLTGNTGTSLFIDPERELVIAVLTNSIYMGREAPGIHAFRRTLHDLIAEAVDSL